MIEQVSLATRDFSAVSRDAEFARTLSQTSPLSASNVPSTDGNAIVANIYQTELGRAVTPEEVNGWLQPIIEGISNGTVDQAGFRRDISKSVEGSRNFIQVTFEQYLNRRLPADDAQLQTWATQISGGSLSRSDFTDFVRNSPEATLFNNSPAGKIRLVIEAYTDGRGKAPAANDPRIAEWASELQDANTNNPYLNDLAKLSNVLKLKQVRDIGSIEYTAEAARGRADRELQMVLIQQYLR
jgi:hypothetical protein